MRFSQYKMIIDLFDSVVEAVEYMTTNSTYELTEECSSAIEKITEAVNSESDNIQLNDILQSINECFINKSFYADFYNDLLTIKKLLPKNIKYKYKILFVAELGGKWDSMESVYKAFIKRDDCDVDVVIEPVFREVMMNDGSRQREIVYDDYLTPMGIKHILYTNYDIAKIKPDIVFTSQPYDGCTLPMFWSENLAKYSRLVYLPYYTALSFNDNVTFDSFFKLNTQKYSWKIPCQSKLMQEYYRQFGSSKGRNTVVTGLPKWDFPMNLNKENCPLPDEWKEKIKNRKVFLWNTHFSVDTYGSQLLTEKIWDFLDVFSKNKDIALIWRPHPMLDTVIKLYYSDKEWHHYEKLKAFVESSDNMVIDKYIPYSYSILYSDALITDLSSMIIQYLFTSKPILTLTKDSVEEARKKLDSSEGLFDYNRILFSDNLNTTKNFIDAVCNGDSQVWESEKNLIKDYLPLADGNVGKRLSDTLINDLYNEVITMT